MTKRISILVRRPQDDREAFTRHWHSVHGGLVGQLPDIACYIQNHVLEEFPVDTPALEKYDIDGLVQLYFEDDAAMRRAFSGPRADPIWEDEKNFLGHSTAYVISGNRQPGSMNAEARMVIVAAGCPPGMDWLEQELRALTGLQSIERNDVFEVVARTAMARGPQPVDTFFCLRLLDAGAAIEAGTRLAISEWGRAAANGLRRLAITRVVEQKIV